MASVSQNGLSFTNFSIVEDNDNSIQFQNNGTVIAQMDSTGLLYDNSVSGLTATTVKGAIDEVQSNIGGGGGSGLPATYSTDTTTITGSSTSKLDFNDSGEIRLGDSNDCVIEHGNTANTTSFTNTSQFLTFDNQNSFAYTKFLIGGNSFMSQFQFRNGDDEVIMNMGGDKFMNIHGYTVMGYSDFTGMAATPRVDVSAATFTDSTTNSNGYNMIQPVVRIRQQTLNASNTGVTTTRAASLYIDDAPVAGTNQTITTSNAIYVGSGDSEFNGNIACNQLTQSTKTSVTQTSTINTSVTSDTRIGVITTVNASITASSNETFTVNCSSCVTGDIVMLTIQDFSGSLGTDGLGSLAASNITNGSFDISVISMHPTNTLSGTITIAYYLL